MPARGTKETWLAKVFEAFPGNENLYDYSLVDYKNARTKVKIRCKKHDWVFEQAPFSHQLGTGCSKCGDESASAKRIKTTNEWIAEVVRKNPDNAEKYDYSISQYKGSHKKVKIRCKKHGVFEQDATSHLNGVKCKQCGNESRSAKMSFDTNEWVEQVIRKNPQNEGWYDYSKVDYQNAHKEVLIGCLRNPEHGFFTQTAHNHMEGKGCVECAKSGFSPEKPAYYYVHKLMKDGEFLCYKAGISNDWERRLGNLRSNSPPEYSFEPVEQIYFESGAEAWEFEQEMKNKTDIRAPVLDMDGGTELFLENPLTTIINRTQT